MNKKLFKKTIFDYRTYLFIGLFLILFAPISEIQHWEKRSTFFSEWAFFAFSVSTLKALLDNFLTVYPEMKKKLKSIKFRNKLWKR